MNKYLITGFSGFVSEHFLEYLNDKPTKTEVIGLDIEEPNFEILKFKNVNISFIKVNLLDKIEVKDILSIHKPNFILHLASFSSVSYSWSNPVESFVNNTNIFLNLIESIRIQKINCRILSVGSSEEYGNVTEDLLPLTEETILDPISPYAVARVSQEMLSKIYVNSYGLDIILTRSFNHIGVNQKEVFVIPSFVEKILTQKKLNKNLISINTGNLSIIRDFVDVRDVVRAYDMLFERGIKGEIYNICSGKGNSLKYIVEIISKFLQVKVNIVEDISLFRPNDNEKIVGSFKKIQNTVGWSPKHSLEDSIHTIIKDKLTII
jgi:GDP-4-dehydro-6-deoxy-D-mannose reductase